MAERTQRLSRRKFLLSAGAAGAATAAAVLAAKPHPAKSLDEKKRASRGYHATEHINNYYRTTQV
jgi:hypothetical protein